MSATPSRCGWLLAGRKGEAMSTTRESFKRKLPVELRPVYALGRELRERGAAVSVAEIPQLGQKKIGLDDYLVAGGRVDDLETFTLGGQAFRSASFWYGRWKMKAAALAA